MKDAASSSDWLLIFGSFGFSVVVGAFPNVSTSTGAIQEIVSTSSSLFGGKYTQPPTERVKSQLDHAPAHTFDSGDEESMRTPTSYTKDEEELILALAVFGRTGEKCESISIFE